MNVPVKQPGRSVSVKKLVNEEINWPERELEGSNIGQKEMHLRDMRESLVRVELEGRHNDWIDNAGEIQTKLGVLVTFYEKEFPKEDAAELAAEDRRAANATFTRLEIAHARASREIG